jgi:uncharacterized membrane protein
MLLAVGLRAPIGWLLIICSVIHAPVFSAPARCQFSGLNPCRAVTSVFVLPGTALINSWVAVPFI